MKLERYKDKKETKRKAMLISLTVITLISITMMLYKTFAKFTATTSFQIMSGKVVYKKKGKEFGVDFMPSESDGLYNFIHSSPVGWEKSEYRYAGASPKNYIFFNCDNGQVENDKTCELWRIIGLVNVKTSGGTIEQRLKIIRDKSIGNYSWDNNGTNDWTESTLMEILNKTYYYGEKGACFVGNSSPSCDFSAGNVPKGLTSKARDMIDNQIKWSLGPIKLGIETAYQAEKYDYYGFNNLQIEWDINNSKKLDGISLFKGVGLMSASDYGFAVGDKNGQGCLRGSMEDFSKSYCQTIDWLYLTGENQWTINYYHFDDYEYTFRTYYINSNGDGTKDTVTKAYAIRPVVYLNAKVTIGEGEGTSESPYHLVG